MPLEVVGCYGGGKEGEGGENGIKEEVISGLEALWLVASTKD